MFPPHGPGHSCGNHHLSGKLLLSNTIIVRLQEAVATRQGGGKSLGYSWFPLQSCTSSFLTSTRWGCLWQKSLYLVRYLSEVYVTDTELASNVTCPPGIICNTVSLNPSETLIYVPCDWKSFKFRYLLYYLDSQGGSTAGGNDPAGAVNTDMRCSDGTELLGNSGMLVDELQTTVNDSDLDSLWSGQA